MRARIGGLAVVPVVVFALSTGLAYTPGQSASGGRHQFEVASIKPNNSGIDPHPGSFAFLPGGRFTAINATLVDLIVRVYPTRRIQLQGGPSWIDSDRFDIVAKTDDADGDLSAAQKLGLVQMLLEDRFKLRLHVESKEVTVTALVTGDSALKLQEPRDGEVASQALNERGQLVFVRTSMGTLANVLSNLSQSVVVDATGLTGSFDFVLNPANFSPSRTDSGPRSSPLSPDERTQPLFAAVKEELGLKVERRKSNIDITVIDHVERPPDGDSNQGIWGQIPNTPVSSLNSKFGVCPQNSPVPGTLAGTAPASAHTSVPPCSFEKPWPN